jgi:hypothetical protein
MLHRLQQSPEAIKAMDQMTLVVRDFLRDEKFPAELVEFAVCEAMRVLSAGRWAQAQVLAHFRTLINSEAARVSTHMAIERRAWLDGQLSTWLRECHRDQ